MSQSLQPSGTVGGDSATATDGLSDVSPGASDQSADVMPTATSDHVDSTITMDQPENDTIVMG